MLELDDIQALLIAPPRHPFGRYIFLTFDTVEDGRAWLSRVLEKVPSAKYLLAFYADGVVPSSGYYLAVTHHGLRALGLDETALATFPDD